MKIPAFLKPGDKIAVVSTARKVTFEEMEPGINLLKNKGFEIVLGDSIGLSENQFAGSDALRANDLQQFLDDNTIKAIWCARGGYGTVRIIEKPDFSRFQQNPKWIIGYSDITVLHNHIHNLGICSLHAPLVFDLYKQPENVQNKVFDTLTGKNIRYEILNSPYNRTGSAEGTLTGGNLSILYSLMGSKTAVNTAGKILFIEDLDEYLYHLDRMMQGLKRSGIFKNLAGLIVGGMNDMRDNTITFGFKTDNPFGKTPQEIILDAVSEYDFPVVFDFPAGHLAENNPLVFGKIIKLEVLEDNVNLT